MTTDRELLELAAKAAGIDDANFDEACNGHIPCNYDADGNPEWWNPLTDDGDALRLAVKLNMGISIPVFKKPRADVITFRNPLLNVIEEGNDPYAATRRAIVRAAAEIGKGLYESAPQEANPANPVSNVDSPAGAAPLPDDVAEMARFLRNWANLGLGYGMKVRAVEAADMLERLARDAAYWKYQADEAGMMRVHYGQQIDQLRTRIAELERQHEGWQWVPKEPTNEMMIAAHHVGNRTHLYQYWQDAWRALPYPDGSFKLVAFDPPHLVRAGPLSCLAGSCATRIPDRCFDGRSDCCVGMVRTIRRAALEWSVLHLWHVVRDDAGEVHH